MRAKVRIAMAACLLLAGCGAKEAAVGPAQERIAGSGEKVVVAAAPDDPPCRGMTVAPRPLPEGTYRTNDVPPDAWPRDYGLPLVITMDLPPVPKQIQRPSPPILEEPER